MNVRIIATALGALLVGTASCLAQSAAETKPQAPASPPAATSPPASSAPETTPTPPDAPKSGNIRITTRAPETDKWDAQRTANGRVFKCKPLACPDEQTVVFQFSKSPTRHIDPKALEKFAKVDVPKGIRAMAAAREVLSDGTEKIETLKSDTATLKTYPAVVNESKFTRSEHVTFMETAIIFAGPVMIRVQSLSPNQELATKALNDFVEAMRIEEGPAPAPGLLPKGMQSL